MILGHHICVESKFVNIVDTAIQSGADVFQVFLGSPQSYKIKRKSKEELIEVYQKAKDNNIKILIHANFMLNFCNPVNSFIHKSAVKILVGDLEDSIVLDAIGVVVHMGKNVKKLNISNEEALDNYVLGIKSVLEKSPGESTIVLETGAGQGTEICTSIEELGILRRMFTEQEQSRLKFCIDTCHIFSAGYDLSNTRYVRFLEGHIQENLGWENVVAIHLNDSKQEVDCHVDRHADIGRGFINIEGLMEFVRICNNYNIPLILETPVDDKDFDYCDQMDLVKSFVL